MRLLLIIMKRIIIIMIIIMKILICVALAELVADKWGQNSWGRCKSNEF